jgi:hypothetical protein
MTTAFQNQILIFIIFKIFKRKTQVQGRTTIQKHSPVSDNKKETIISFLGRRWTDLTCIKNQEKIWKMLGLERIILTET